MNLNHWFSILNKKIHYEGMNEMSNILKNEEPILKNFNKIKTYYHNLDEKHEEKSIQLNNIRKDIKNIKELLNLLKEVEDTKERKKKLKSIRIIFDILISTIVIGICFIVGMTIPNLIIAGIIVVAIKHLEIWILSCSTCDKDVINNIEELKKELQIEEYLNYNYSMAKDLLKQKENTQNNLLIELDTLAQKVNYFANLIKQINLYFKFPTLEKEYNELVSFMQHNPCLVQIINENASLIESKWQEYLNENDSHKNYTQKIYDIPSIKLEYKKD